MGQKYGELRVYLFLEKISPKLGFIAIVYACKL